MKLCIHRGTAEIGGNCIEVEASGQSILLDLGAPLMGNLSPVEALPPVKGLTDGTNANLLGIVISHPHADHYGLASLAHPSIPIYIGNEANKLLRAAMAFGPFGAVFPKVVNYQHRNPFQIGQFTVTPYLNDHSAFDAYSFLIRADGKSLFYSGDIRGHGWKARMFDQLLATGPKDVDVMLLEGTTLGRKGEERSETEATLVEHLIESISGTDGLILAAFSGQNIDRLVTFYKAIKATRRSFIVDVYIAHLLRSLGRKSLPDPTSGALRVFLPRRHKIGIIRNQAFDLIEPYRSRRIYPHELRKRRRHLAMTFRVSMVQDLTDADCLDGARLIYSMWPGYLERGSPDLREWCVDRGVDFEIIHTSGHADAYDLKRLVEALRPKRLIPIHTLTPDRYRELSPNTTPISDGTWTDI